MKIVVNRCYGGFSVSDEAVKHMGLPLKEDRTFADWNFLSDIRRDDPRLVAAVEALGERANGHCAKLEVVEIPDGIEWDIEEYDGLEHIAEAHRTW